MEQQDNGPGCIGMVLLCAVLTILIVASLKTLERINDLERRVGVLEQQVGSILKPKEQRN